MPVRRGGALLLAASVAGCSREPPPPSTTQVHAPPRAGVETPPPKPFEPPSPSGPVLGHVRVGDPFALLAKVSAQLAPPEDAGTLTLDGLRKVAREGASTAVARSIAEHVDPGRPVACALLDPLEHPVPLSCVFGYTGGLTQLLVDLGNEGRQPGGSDTVAHYQRDGWDVHLSALGRDVVVAFDDRAAAGSGAYLEALTRAGGPWDVEVTLHLSAAVGRFRGRLDAAIDALIGEAASLRDDPLTLAVLQVTAREIALLTPVVADDGRAALDEVFDLAAGIDRVQLGARLDDDGFVAALRVDPIAGSVVAGALHRRQALPRELLQWTPRHTWLLWAQTSEGDPLAPKAGALAGRVAATLVGDAIGQPADAVGTAMRTFADENAELYGEASLLALFNGGDTWGGGAFVRPLRDGVAAREAWLRFGRELTPNALLGPDVGGELAKIVTWSLDADARDLDGIAVDRWQLRTSPRFSSRLSRTLGEDPGLASDLLTWVESKPALVAIDRVQLEGAAAYVFAPGGGEAYLERVVQARRGAARASHDGLDRVLSRHPRPRFVLALSVADLVAFLHQALPPDLLTAVPDRLGRDLGDVALAGFVTAEDAFVTELRVAQPIIDALRR